MTTTTSAKEPTSSSFASRSSGSYDVFLSFSGEDTRWTFADHLYTALRNAGFRTFRDDDEIQRGESINVELQRAIEESRVSIVVLSRNYASSTWCLDELAMILGRRRRRDSGHVVLPVFYGVDPSEVRKQKGVYAEAFARYEERFKFEVGEGEAAKGWKEKLKGWREALQEVAGLAGIPDGVDRYESKLIQKIIKEVEDKLSRPRVLNVAPYPIGLDSRAESINLWLQDGGFDVRLIAICGMGGIGKTTIAKFVYNSNSSKFEGSSFLANVREISGQQNGLIRLQSQLLSDILSRREVEIRNVDEGILKIKEVIGCKRVLIILDDVDKWEQLDAVFGMKDWLSPGSKLIITTRHEQLVRAHECWKVHKVEKLDHDESLQLFSWYAFGQSHPIDGYLIDSKKAVDYCGGIPLAVKILGRFLSSTSLDVWKSQLQKLIAIPHNEILEILKLSYDSLQDDHDKNLFLDIACFFVGGDIDTTITILKDCYDFALAGIQNLIDRNMLTIEHNRLVMHQLIQEMGREIVRQKSPEELGERSRLWNHKDSLSVLKGKTGTRKIRGLVLDMHFLKEDESEWNSFGPNSCSKKGKRFPFSIFFGFPLGIATKNSNVAFLEGDAFSRMSNLQLLQISHVQLFGNYENFPKGLRWLHWSHFPLQMIPNDFPLDKLVALEMPYSCLKKVLNGAKCLQLLKILNLSHSHYFVETPDFSRLPNLKRLIFENCTRLVKVDESIGCLERLVFLNLRNCQSLRELPQTFYKLKSLATLDLSGCLNLGNFSAELGNMNSLAVLLPDGTAINPLFSITWKVKAWLLSSWPWPLNPRSRPEFSWVSFPESLVGLSLANCNLSDDSFPRDFSSLSSLRKLNLSENPIRSLPNCIRDHFGLKSLWLHSCPRLLTLDGLPKSLEDVQVDGCKLLEKISFDSADFTGKILTYRHCRRLVEISGLYKVKPLESDDAELINNLGFCDFFEGMGKSYIEFSSISASHETWMSPPLGLHQPCTICTYVRGSKMPIRFNLKNVGSSVSFTMPSDANFRTQGLSVCSVYAPSNDLRFEEQCLRTIISNATKQVKWSYCPELLGFPLNEEDDVTWLSYWKFEDQLEGGDEVNISVTSACFQVKEVGVHVVYKEEAEEKKSTQSLSLEVLQQIHSYGNVVPGFCKGDCEDCKKFPVPGDPASTRFVLPADADRCPEIMFKIPCPEIMLKMRTGPTIIIWPRLDFIFETGHDGKKLGKC
ncbi:disease resistance protein RUN1-like isoform X1 [Diospyros lotus]|uniref:disease resistance protein RUN1-like isoform X1 n=1 Tax=Diospyros lotus TaxID=55363 RepID=UPI00225925D7|nr:disease resistance protein RUN1-like isoform X1 [Diospyros lotus]